MLTVATGEIKMTNKRYLAALRMCMLTMEEVDCTKISQHVFIHITKQYGKSMGLTYDEIIEVLHTKPFDMMIREE